MKNLIGCVLCSYNDRHLLGPFIAAWEAMETGIRLVLLKDNDSEDFDTHGLAEYPLLWEKDRDISLAPGVAASLNYAAVREKATAVVKLDVDCIHQNIDWIKQNACRDVIGFTHLTDDRYFFGAAYYITTKVLGDITYLLADRSDWLRPEDMGMAKAARELNVNMITLPIAGVVCGTSDKVEYKPSLFSTHSIIHCGEFTKSRQGRARVAYMMKRLNTYNNVTKHKRAVVYPIRQGNADDSNIEIMLSMRSLSNLKEDVPVFVLSESIPPNLSGAVNFIKVLDYQDALEKACDIADEILWMNDDICLLKPQTWEDFREWVVHGDQWSDETIEANSSHSNKWRQRKGEVVNKLKEDGHTLFDFSSHTPYLYKTDILREILADYNFGYKTAYETAYGNVAQVPHRRNFRKLQRYHDGALPIDSSVYDVLNYSDKGATNHLRGFLLGMFPKPSVYEAHDAKNLTRTPISTIR